MRNLRIVCTCIAHENLPQRVNETILTFPPRRQYIQYIILLYTRAYKVRIILLRLYTLLYLRIIYYTYYYGARRSNVWRFYIEIAFDNIISISLHRYLPPNNIMMEAIYPRRKYNIIIWYWLAPSLSDYIILSRNDEREIHYIVVVHYEGDRESRLFVYFPIWFRPTA